MSSTAGREIRPADGRPAPRRLEPAAVVKYREAQKFLRAAASGPLFVRGPRRGEMGLRGVCGGAAPLHPPVPSASRGGYYDPPATAGNQIGSSDG